MSSTQKSVLSSAIADVSAVFSDIDGTIAHYAKTLVRLGYERLDSPPPNWRAEDEVFFDDIDRLLLECYPVPVREERFAAIPCQFWRHVASNRTLKMYELYNLSLTGAVISENTVLLMELLQDRACLFRHLSTVAAEPRDAECSCKPVLCCLITGARTSTFVRRREGGSLPQSVFESCEGGSKLWCRLQDPLEWFKNGGKALGGGEAATGAPLFLPAESRQVPMDISWTNRFSTVTGFCADSSPEDNARRRDSQRTLWNLEDELRAAGFATDHEDYETSFLIDIRNSPCVRSSPSHDGTAAAKFPAEFDDAESAEKWIVSQFRETFNDLYGVELFVNLGKGQVNARGSGKRGVMLHVLEKAAEMEDAANRSTDGRGRYCVEKAVALFDDENDLQFAELCGAGILPSVAHDDVLKHKQWNCDPSARRWFRPPTEGPLGSEWALKQIVLLKRERATSN